MHSACWQTVDYLLVKLHWYVYELPPFFWSTCRYTSLRVSTNWSWWGEICKKYWWLNCWLGLIKRNLPDVKKIMLTKCWLRLICKSTHLIHLSNRPTHLQNLSFANFDELGPWWCAVILINIGKQPRKKRFDIKGILEGGHRQKKWIRWRSDRPSIKQPNGGTERCQLCALLDTTLGRDKTMRDSKSALIIHKITIW